MSILNNRYQVKNVSHQINNQTILKEINLTMEDGKIYSIIGPSGAGKTTLLQLLSGLQTVQSGECLFKG